MKGDVNDLSPFFFPKSIALVGVSQEAGGLGGRSFLERYLEAGYGGRIYPIHPHASEIMGIRAYRSLLELPELPDLAMIALPSHRVPAALEDCARIGARFIHILSAGFSELGTPEGKQLEDAIRDIAMKSGLFIMGPNCMGPYCPASHLTAWGAIPGITGGLGVISQSGGITQRLTEYVCSLGLGVSKAASIGNATCLDTTDFLAYLAEDEGTRVIAIYLEGTNDGRKLLSLARTTAVTKPIIMLKGGESERGALTVSSHTGKMAGHREVWQAFFRQSRVVPVTNINEWVDAILALSLLPPARGNRVFIVGGGGGNSILYADTCIREGLSVPAPEAQSLDRLRPLVPMAGSIAGNPLDYWEAYISAERLCDILDIAYHDTRVDLLLVDRLIPRRAYHSPPVADYVAEVSHFITHHPARKPTVFTIDYDGGDGELWEQGATLRRRFCEAGIPAYPAFERAARALAHFADCHNALTTHAEALY